MFTVHDYLNGDGTRSHYQLAALRTIRRQ